jgi:aconitate hydratase
MNDLSQTLKPINGKAANGYIYSLPALEEAGIGPISKLPVSIRIVLESVLRNVDGKSVTVEDVKTLANWDAKNPSSSEIPFVVSRIVLQDFTGVPLLVDLAAMRDAVNKLGKNPSIIEPLVPVDLVVDHSVQVDRAGTVDAFKSNLKLEFERNRERYEFLKWGQSAFETFSVVPPAIGIVHQVNLEYLAKVVFEKQISGKNVLYPDTLVGTDSHTTMINGLGIVGWGVGGIEAEAGMLGQPVYFQTPEVIGVNLTGKLKEGVTATDLTLRITELLRQHKVVGKFVEFHGEGAENLTLADRGTIANMAPEYGATMGYFPVDEKTLDYLRMTGRSEDQITLVKEYFEAQGMFGMPKAGELTYTKVIDLDMGAVEPCVAGPKRPQDRIQVSDLKDTFNSLLGKTIAEGGYGISEANSNKTVPVQGTDESITHGSVLIAAITSCTNTSNPNVMVAAGLVAKKAVEKGLSVKKTVKTSLAPGSRVVTEYLNKTGLQPFLDQLGFNLVGYGCTTCIGNSGPLEDSIEKAIKEGEIVATSVLSGNRNFEARVHGSIKGNFLMSPPLVVAYAIAGKVDINLQEEALGTDKEGNPVYLKDLWPSHEEIVNTVNSGITPEMFTSKYSSIVDANPEWTAIESVKSELFNWNDDSTYIQHPPFFENFSSNVDEIQSVSGMKALLILGDSVTTDHISPAGAILKDGPAGRFLQSKGVEPKEFNSFGSRRGNDRIMTRGTFANVRIKNFMADGKEGGYTKSQNGEVVAIYDACEEYKNSNTPLIVFAGVDYGMGSSRDWAAKGTSLLGVKAVVAKSFERIHRSNLIGMGVLPLEFTNNESAESLGFNGTETFDLPELNNNLRPGQNLDLIVTKADGSKSSVTLKVRIDTEIEVEYYRNGGILPFVLRKLVEQA